MGWGKWGIFGSVFWGDGHRRDKEDEFVRCGWLFDAW